MLFDNLCGLKCVYAFLCVGCSYLSRGGDRTLIQNRFRDHVALKCTSGCSISSSLNILP